MKLRCGKAKWLDLERMPLKSRLKNGLRVFEAEKTSASRAAVLANRVIVRTFAKTFDSEAERAIGRVDGDKVDVAAFRDTSGKHRIVYREAVVRFEPGISQSRRKAVLAKFRLRVRARNAFVADQVIVFDPTRKYAAERMVELANELTATEEVEFAFPNFVSEYKRTAVPQPRSEQWHLPIVKARKAWDTTLGDGITIAILDDGVDLDHPTLRDNIRRRPDPDEPRDRFGRDFFVEEEAGAEHFDPRPKIFRFPFTNTETNDIHGTPCAGVAAATGKAGKVFGIAPKAQILPVKIFHGEGLATESQTANAVRYAFRFADILSCSWDGPEGPDMNSALEEAGAGRAGRGCPIFAATGNEDSRIGYPARTTHVIAVGASTDKEKRASYSNHGRQISILAPSSGGANDAEIFTTDVSFPNRGYNPGEEDAGGTDGRHCNDFGGTSSATPLAAGVAALVLSANPNLNREQVRAVLQESADKIGPKSAYGSNGHGPKYGFGRVNAAKAIAHALALAADTPQHGAGRSRRDRARRARSKRR